MTHTRYALIGDIHSQLAPLESALNHCLSGGLTPILLGDLFDSRCETSDSAGVYRAVRKIEQEIPGTIVLQSNHQNKLIRFLNGNNVKVSPDLATTLKDFEKGGIDLTNDLLPWLLSRPYGVVFKDSTGVEYRCAHACFPGRILVPHYDGCHYVMAEGLSRREIDTMIYGPFYKVTLEGGKVVSDRLPWWQEEVTRNWVKVAGHYHTVHIGEKSIVLDGQMGGSSLKEVDPQAMRLCLYDVESRIVHYFDVRGNQKEWSCNLTV